MTLAAKQRPGSGFRKTLTQEPLVNAGIEPGTASMNEASATQRMRAMELLDISVVNPLNKPLPVRSSSTRSSATSEACARQSDVLRSGYALEEASSTAAAAVPRRLRGRR